MRARRGTLRGGGGGAPRRALAVGLVACGLLACAGPLFEVPGGYHHASHGYRISVPEGPGSAWERVSVEGAELAFRNVGSGTMSLQSRCGKPVASPQLMARHLMIGLSDRALVGAGPVEVNGMSGWSQVFDTGHGGAPVRIKTVTLIAGDCSYDWVLAVPHDFPPAEAIFDAWVGSFRLDEPPKPGPEQTG